jgi:formyltetrahydrofolate-dependent phosphoribosylglycinamide formyltransferase
MSPKINLGVLGSTRGTDLQFIIDAINSGQLNSSVQVVISNRRKAMILGRAKRFGIKSVFIDHKGRTREDFDRDVSQTLNEQKVDLVLLIGFMRILSDWFCKEWAGQVLNVHPSLLPKYAGGMDTDVHAEVLKNGDSETGCTIHFVTEDLDAGPVLVQKKCPVKVDDTPETLKGRVQKLEGLAFLEAIQLYQSGMTQR